MRTIFKWDSEMTALAIKMYVEDLRGLRQIADRFGTNHHSVKRLLIASGVEIGRKNAKRVFTAEHRAAIGAAHKGIPGWNTGLKMPELSRFKNLVAHSRFPIDLEWAMQFDLESLMMINQMLTPRSGRWAIEFSEYVKIVEKFAADAAFQRIFAAWRGCGKEFYMTPTIDHIVPVARGGADVADNLQVLTWFENRCKNDMTQTEWDAIKSNINRYFV